MKISVSSVEEALIIFLTGDFAYSAELQAFWMAFQGAMAVRNGANRDRKMHWFHAFVLSALSGYGGAMFTPLWMGHPTSMLSNDMNIAACILAFCIANYIPFDLGYKLGNTLPVVAVTVSFAQLFRALGVIKFTFLAFDQFKNNPSKYYPTPIFGPILYASLLGNMSGFFIKGFNKHLENGMPWPFQNGLFCATFYHFFVHDQEGWIGKSLRKHIHSLGVQGNLDDQTFAVVTVSFFVQVVGLLQIPSFLGPGFSPFTVIGSIPGAVLHKVPKWDVNKTTEGTPTSAGDAAKKDRVLQMNGDKSAEVQASNPATATGEKKKRNRRRKNKVKDL